MRSHASRSFVRSPRLIQHLAQTDPTIAKLKTPGNLVHAVCGKTIPRVRPSIFIRAKCGAFQRDCFIPV